MPRIDFRNIAIFDAQLLPSEKGSVPTHVTAWQERAYKAGMDACYLRLHSADPAVISLVLNSMDKALAKILPYSLYSGTSGVRGVHFKENEAITEVAPALLRGKSCHSLGSVMEAQDKGLDYVFFSPIFETKTHPEAVGVGLETLREVCAATTLPVFALGGISADNREHCLAAGARGIAAISMFCEGESLI